RECGVQFVQVDFQFFRQISLHFLQRRGQVAVVVQRLDQKRDQRPVTLAFLGDAQLRHQVIAPRGARFVNLQRRQVVVVGGGTGTAVVLQIPLGRIAVAVGRETVVL